MRNRFDNQLEKLNNELIEMGSMIEQAIEKAISALVNSDVELAKLSLKAMKILIIRNDVLKVCV